jgi:nucleotide-binding universal stress UspA family protein
MAEGLKSQVVVGVDGSPESLAALQWAADYCERFEAQLMILVAWHIPTEHASAVAALQEVDLELAASDVIKSALDQVRALHGGLEVTQQVVSGSPGKVLVQSSADAALLVVGTKRTLGTVSSYCAHYASCPVVIVRTAP